VIQNTQPPYRFFTSVKVRFSETDCNGHMSNISIPIYMEQARCEYFEGLGLFDLETIAKEGKTLVLAAIAINYQAPAYFNETLRVYMRTTRVGKSSIDLEALVINPDKKLTVATGTSTVVYFDNHTHKSTPLPANLSERIQQFEESFEPLHV
jgi:acyl-CoA thioester hydrolase